MSIAEIFIVDDVPLDNANESNVMSASFIRLPFHLGVGELFLAADCDEPMRQVWLQNRVSIPPGATVQDWFRLTHDAWHRVATNALLVFEPANVTLGDLDSLHAGKPPALRPEGRGQMALAELNAFLVSYAIKGTHSPIYSGGRLPRLVNLWDYFNATMVNLTLITRDRRSLDSSSARRVFDHYQDIDFGASDIEIYEDFAGQVLTTIKDAVQLHRAHAFYELFVRAKTAIRASEPLVAIVLASAALEGAHAAFLRARTDFTERALNDVLREQGIFKLLPRTRQWYADELHAITDAKMTDCLDAITLRNKIIHVTFRSGEYEIAGRTFNELNAAYGAIASVYLGFVAALESLPP